MCHKNNGILEKEAKVYGKILKNNFSYRLEIADYILTSIICELDEIKKEIKCVRHDFNG